MLGVGGYAEISRRACCRLRQYSQPQESRLEYILRHIGDVWEQSMDVKVADPLHHMNCFCTCQKPPFVHNSVCSPFLEGLFAILAECSQFCLRSF